MINQQKFMQPFSFFVSDETLPSDNPLRFSKNLLQKLLLVRQSIAKLGKTKSKAIYTDKLLRFFLYHQEILVNINF